MLIIGHRGAAGPCAENTLGAIRYALECDVDGVEFDVRLLDRRLIVLHDDTVDRTTNGYGRYKNLTLSQLRALSTKNNEQIPYLEEILDLTGSACLVNIEIKEAGIAGLVIDAVEAYFSALEAVAQTASPTILYSSFDPATTTELARLHHRGFVGVLFENDIDDAFARAQAINAWSIHFSIEQLQPEQVKRAHDVGLKVLVYTVDAPHHVEHCLEYEVDGIFCDFPDTTGALVRRLAADDH